VALLISALIGALILSVASFLSESYCISCSIHKKKIISFTAGLVVTYLFLQLFPEFFLRASDFSPFLFFSVLVGFSFFHLGEKLIYSRTKNLEQLEQYLKTHHRRFVFLDHLIIGLVLVSFFQESLISGILFTIPVLLFVMGSGISIHHLHSVHAHIDSLPKRIGYATPIIIGSLIALFYPVPLLIQEILIGFIIGSFILVIVREIVPDEKKELPLYFILGAALYSILIIFSWGLLAP